MRRLSALRNGLGLSGNWCIEHALTSPFLTEKKRLCLYAKNYYKKYTMVLKGLSNATDLNVLQGKAYKKPC